MTSPAFPFGQKFAPPTEATFRQIIHNGQYYYPACNHYQRETTVNCDRCQRSQIPACIGWREYDLCLGCAQLIVEQTIQMRMSSQVEPRFTLTRMQISSAYPRQQITQEQRPIPPSQKPTPITFMHTSSAFPATNMQISSAFPTTNMQISSAFPTTNMQISSAFPKNQDDDLDNFTFMHTSSAFP